MNLYYNAKHTFHWHAIFIQLQVDIVMPLAYKTSTHCHAIVLLSKVDMQLLFHYHTITSTQATGMLLFTITTHYRDIV